MTGLLFLIVNVIRDTLTDCRHPGWYPMPIRRLRLNREHRRHTHGSTTVPRRPGPRR